MPLETEATAPQKSSLSKNGLQNKVRHVGSTIKRRVRKVYKSARGDNDCSPEEIMLTRLLLLITFAKIYHKLYFSPYWMRIKRNRTLQAMKKRHATSADVVGSETDKASQCCICLEEGLSDLGDVPCSSKIAHTDKICIVCLTDLHTRGMDCPLCRGAL